MSVGCPVVAFDCDYGPREIITHGFNGLLVKANDIQGLKNTIIELLSNKQLRNKIIINGLIRSSEFDAKTLSIQWLKDS
jgi:glycosyltransferase involved in cell wall biosynthesis